jgi:hypothetical protein
MAGAQRQPTAPILAQLPPDVPHFTGPSKEITEISQALSASGDRAPVVGITGLGGTGESALAIHAARLMSDRFPDGLMYADLGLSGNAQEGAAEVLASFPRARGVRTDDIPPGQGPSSPRIRSPKCSRRCRK